MEIFLSCTHRPPYLHKLINSSSVCATHKQTVQIESTEQACDNTSFRILHIYLYTQLLPPSPLAAVPSISTMNHHQAASATFTFRAVNFALAHTYKRSACRMCCSWSGGGLLCCSCCSGGWHRDKVIVFVASHRPQRPQPSSSPRRPRSGSPAAAAPVLHHAHRDEVRGGPPRGLESFLLSDRIGFYSTCLHANDDDDRIVCMLLPYFTTFTLCVRRCHTSCCSGTSILPSLEIKDCSASIFIQKFQTVESNRRLMHFELNAFLV